MVAVLGPPKTRLFLEKPKALNLKHEFQPKPQSQDLKPQTLDALSVVSSPSRALALAPRDGKTTVAQMLA